LLLALAAPNGAASAQSIHSVTLRVDNDAFNFWRTAGSRPDEEFTSGVHLIYEGGDAPWWGRAFAKSLQSCTPGAAACRTRAFEFGQNIYTPRRTDNALTPPPGSRPNAGWLHADERARVLHNGRADDVGITVGVTGEPALGQFTQRVAHAVAPGFNRPIDWSEQLGFEPGLILRYEQTRRIPLGRAFDLLPHGRVELGNVVTAVETGLRARWGWNLRHPWLPATANAPTELVLLVGATARGVARDLFLDGNTFGPGPRVGHEPFTHAVEWSLTLRREWLTVSYGAVTESRGYPAGPASHTWSSLSAGIRFDR
jgi:hypothetical protein